MAIGDLRGTLTVAATSTTNPTAATGSVSVSVGDVGVVVFAERSNLTVGTVTDNLGNTWNAQNAGTDGGNATGRAYWFRFTSAGTLTSVSGVATSSNDDITVVAAVFEGPFDSSPLDTNPSNLTGDTTSPYSCPATGTLAQADEVVIGWMAQTNGDSAMVAGGSFTMRIQNISAGGTQGISAAIASLTVAATTTQTPTFTTGAVTPNANVLGTMSFKARGPTDQQVEGSFSGAGALSGALRQGMVARATFGGAGALAADITIPATLRAIVSWVFVSAVKSDVVTGVHQVSASFVGAGALTSNLNLGLRVTASYSGAGLLAATPNMGVGVSALFSGAGALTASLYRITYADATFAGAGGLSASLRQNMVVSATFGGLGALTANLSGIAKAISATFAGAGNLTASLNQGMGVQATFQGAGALTADIRSNKLLSASFQGAGGLAAALNLGMRIDAAFAGAGALTSEITIPGVSNAWAVEATFAGVGAMTATLAVGQRVSSTYAGAGSLTASLVQRMAIAASFAGAGSLSLDTFRQNMAVRATFQGAGALTALLSRIEKFVAANFAGAGNLTTSLNLRMLIAAQFNGAGNLTATINVGANVHQVEASFAGAGALVASLRLGMRLTANFGGVGTQTVELRQRMVVRATFAGLGELVSDIVVPVAGGHQVAAIFAGAGSLSADITIIEGSRIPTTGYESQIGVWHPHGGRAGRTGKRYRIYGTSSS